MKHKALASKRQQVIFSICVILVSGGVVHAQSQSQTPAAARQSSPGKQTTMPHHARGTFEVKVTPQKPDNKETETANLERLSIDKQFHGDLEGTSTGEMLASRGDVKGSGGYVAMERVKATLTSRKGAFVLQHSGTMTHNTPQMSVTVVPDSGTGDLTGIAGSMTIKIEEGKHFYDFEYTLPQQH